MKMTRAWALALGVLTYGCASDGADGAPGEAGAMGERGARGEQGEAGEPGAQGPRGEAGTMGEQGEQGEQGPEGEQGPVGWEGRQDVSDYVDLENGSGRKIVAMGGNGTDGDGGEGDYFEVYNYSDDVHVRMQGTPNTSFDVPTYQPYLGDNPKTVTADAT